MIEFVKSWSRAIVVYAIHLFAWAGVLHANGEQPNILWITSEDNNVHWVGTGQPALLIDGELPLEDAYVNFTDWSAEPNFMFASGYLNELHSGRVRNLSRGVAVREGDHVIVRDTIKALVEPLRIRWQLRALTGDVTLNENGATLRKAGHSSPVPCAQVRQLHRQSAGGLDQPRR